MHPCELRENSGSNLPKLPPNVRFYSRWRRTLQKCLLVSARHPFTRFYLRSQAAIAFEKKRHGRSRFWWVVHPCSDLRYCWDLIMTLVLLYVFLLMPYITSFRRLVRNAGADCLAILYPAYALCIADVAFNFVTGFASSDGHEIFLDPVLIVRHYTPRYFLLDLVSSVPYSWFDGGGGVFVDAQPARRAEYTCRVVAELVPVLKVFRLPTLRRYIRQINASCDVSRAAETIIWIALLTILIFHWSACIIHAFSCGIPVARTKEESERRGDAAGRREPAEWRVYLASLHSGASNLIGSSSEEMKQRSDTADKTIRCVLLLLGKGYKIYLIAIILQLVRSSAEPELKYQETVHRLKEYGRKRKLPRRLREKLVAYYEYRFHGHFFKENAISNTLSSHLRQEIIVHGSRGLLKSATMFRNLPRALLTGLMAALKPLIYLEEDVIYKAETDGDYVYFIASGTVALLTFSGKEICHARDGECFGEMSLIYPAAKRLESAIALEVCELLYLDRRDFKRLVPTGSGFYESLRSVAEQRIDKMKKLTKDEISRKGL